MIALPTPPSEFELFVWGKGIQFVLIEQFLHPFAQLLGEFEEGEVVDALDADAFSS